MRELYYAMCFDGSDEERLNFYHCIALAKSEEDFRATVLNHRNVELTKISTVTDYLKESGYKKEIFELSRQIDDYNPIIFSDPIRFFSPWGESEEENKSQQRYLNFTEKEIPPLKELENVPSWDQDWIAADLKEMLFEQPRDGEQAYRIYLLVDATSRKNITGYFDLDENMIDLPMKCLFKGKAFEDLEEVAPYLIDMTLSAQALEDVMYVPRFHRDFFKKHWGKNTGIFIKTPLPLDAVWAHFRKFTQYHDENKKAFFFRFWESSIFIEYWKYFSFSYERVCRFFMDSQGNNDFEIHFCVDNKITTFIPDFNKIKQGSGVVSPFTLDDDDHRVLQEIVDKRFKNDICLQLEHNLDGYNQEIRSKVKETVDMVFKFIHKRSYGNSVKFDDCFSLSMLVMILGDAAQDVLDSPLLNDQLIPISQAILLAKESYFETMEILINKEV